MGGEDDGKAAQAQVAGEPQAQGDEAAAQQMQVTSGTGSGEGDKARADYEAALRERGEKIAALEGEIAEAAKTAESAERLRAKMDELWIGNTYLDGFDRISPAILNSTGLM